MIGIIWRLAITVGLTGLLVINSLGSASVLILQNHRRQISNLESVSIPERNEVVAAAKSRLDLSAELAPWSLQPQEDKLAFAVWLAETGFDINQTWDDLSNIFLAAVRRAPTRAELYINLANLYLTKPEIFPKNYQERNYWVGLLTMAKRLNPTMPHTEFLWGKLIYKALPVKTEPSRDKVSEICSHFGNGLALLGDKVNWDVIRESYNICFGLTRDIELLRPLIPVNSASWRLWGEYFCTGDNNFWREAAPFVEKRLQAKELTADDCLALVKGLSDNCIAEAIRLMQACIKLHPGFNLGWTWLFQNMKEGGIIVKKTQLANLSHLALKEGNLNDKQIASIVSLLCKNKMYNMASFVLEKGIRISRRNDSLLEAMAGCLVDRGKTQDATEMLEAVLARQPNMVWAWLALGQLQWDNGQMLSGEQSLSRVLKLDPGNRQAINYLKKRGIY